jgi:hypothetical protein
MRWRKSSFSSVSECVEVAEMDDGQIGVRNSKQPDAGMVVFTRGDIDAFVKGVKAGEFDDFA